MKFFLWGMCWILLLGSILIWSALNLFTSAPILIGSITGGTILACLFVSSGFVSYYRCRFRDLKAFGKIFLVSTFSRLALCAIILVLLFKWTAIQQEVFLISLCSWFFVLHIWEIISLNRLMECRT
jgi:hypothetical protein